MRVKNSKHITFTALALVITAAISFGSTAFSQGGYPPPTGLTATTQSVGSGQIKLAWVKPSSNAVIGYNIYRDGAYLDYAIGGGTLSYYDGDLPPSAAYDYFVKAVYVGVAEADLPASNIVSAVSPAYCTSGPAYCVGNNPFVAGLGRTIVDLKGKKLDANRHQSEIFTVSLPAGRYQVYVRTFDAFPLRYQNPQSNERWFVKLSSGGREVAQTNLTIDLLDHLNEMGSTQVIETELVLTEPVNKIQAVHAGVVNGGSFDDVGTSAVMFVNMDEAGGCELVINKSANKTEVAPGDVITYTITVANEGTENCTGGGNYIYDYLPSQVIYVSETESSGMGFVGYYEDGHYVRFNAYSPLVPGEEVVATITVQVRTDIPESSCDGEPGDDDDGGSDFSNIVYVTNNEYGARSMNVYSNSVATLCDADPEPDPIIDTTVVPSPNPSYPGGSVTWTATPFGECPGPFSYSWTGDDGLTGSTASINHIYNNPGSYDATVTVTAPGCKPVTKQSPTPVVVEWPAPSSVSCSATPSIVDVGRPVNWQAAVDPLTPPGGGSYSYSWTGTDGLSGTVRSVIKTYNSVGIKNAAVSVAGASEPALCSATVRERATPKYEEI